MAKRLALAEDRPLERKLMAAMAQLDCGACGYLCKTYAEAVARGEDKDLTKCAPGGKETAGKLKELVGANGNIQSLPAAQAKIAAITGHDHRNPLTTRLLKCTSLVQSGSAKDTRLIVFDFKGTALPY